MVRSLIKRPINLPLKTGEKKEKKKRNGAKGHIEKKEREKSNRGPVEWKMSKWKRGLIAARRLFRLWRWPRLGEWGFRNNISTSRSEREREREKGSQRYRWTRRRAILDLTIVYEQNESTRREGLLSARDDPCFPPWNDYDRRLA